MKGWERCTLAKITDKITDGSHNPPKGASKSLFMMLSSKNIQNDAIDFSEPRYLTQQQFEQENKRTAIRGGDVLLTIVGTIGRCATVPLDAPTFTLQRSVAVIRPQSDTVLSRFLMYALLARKDHIIALGRGVAQKGVYLETLRQLEINLPPIPEQRRIVALLDDAFAGLETLRANAEKNVQNARELFDQYLEAQFSGSEPKPGWQHMKFSEFSIVQSGSGFPLKFQGNSGGNIPYYKVSDMNLPGNERGMTSANNFISEAVRKELGASIFPIGSVIFPKIGGAIATNKKRLVRKPCCVDNNVMGIVPRQGKVISELLFYIMLGRNLSDFANKAHLPSIRKSDVENALATLPTDLHKQKQLVVCLDCLMEATTALQGVYSKKLAAIDTLKQALLHRAFTGQLTAAETAAA